MRGLISKPDHAPGAGAAPIGDDEGRPGRAHAELDALIERLIERADIVDVVAQDLPGMRSEGAKGICPFHDHDDEPSLEIDAGDGTGRVRCMRCKVTADALAWLRRVRGMTRGEAAAELARRAGVDTGGLITQERIDDERSVRRQAVERVAQRHARALANHPGAKAYLEGRGIDAKAQEAFGIGYAAGGDDEIEVDGEEGRQALIQAGLLVCRAGRGDRARFRDRIMFPIRAPDGRIAGFGAGSLPGSARGPKYVNSSASATFVKRELLYGLHEVLAKHPRPDRLVLVEGYTDVVTLHRHGIDEAIATLGTAINVEHLGVIFDLTDRLTMCFDGDGAGRAAARRALEKALPVLGGERRIDFVQIARGEDPDSLVRDAGAQAFDRLLRNARGAASFLVDEYAPESPSPRIGELAGAARDVVEMIATVKEASRRREMSEEAGKLLGLDLTDLVEEAAEEATGSAG